MKKNNNIINFYCNGIPHQIRFSGSKITIDNINTVMLKSLPKTKIKGYTQYSINVDGNMLDLFISTYGNRYLVQNGIDCETGQPFQALTMPKWAYIFVFMCAIFFAFLDGAIGGAFVGGSIAIILQIASNHRMSVGKRVGLCFAAWGILLAAVILIATLWFGFEFAHFVYTS